MHKIFSTVTDSSRGLKCKTFCKMCSRKNSAKNLQKFCRFFCKIFATFLQFFCNFFAIFFQFFFNFFSIFLQIDLGLGQKVPIFGLIFFWFAIFQKRLLNDRFMTSSSFLFLKKIFSHFLQKICKKIAKKLQKNCKKIAKKLQKIAKKLQKFCKMRKMKFSSVQNFCKIFANFKFTH